MRRVLLAVSLIAGARANALVSYRLPLSGAVLSPPATMDPGLADVLLLWAPMTNSMRSVSVRAEPRDTTGGFARASVATDLSVYTGLVVKYASGAPRFASGYYRWEGARTNLILNSECQSCTPWAALASSAVANAASDPFGGTGMCALIEDSTANSLHGVYQGYARTASTNQEIGAYFMAPSGGRSIAVLGLTDGGAGGPILLSPQNGAFETFNLATGAVGNAIAVGSGWSASGGKITAVPGVAGMYRCVVNITTGTGTSASLFLGMSSSISATNYDGGGSSSIYVCAADANNNVAFDGTYIPTGGASVARPADTSQYSATLNVESGPGTLIFTQAAEAPSGGGLLGLRVGDGVTGIGMTINPAGNQASLLGGGANWSATGNAGTRSLVYTTALAWGYRDNTVMFGHDPVLHNTTAESPPIHRFFYVGTSGSGSNLWGRGRDLMSFGARLPDSDLMAFLDSRK